MRRVDAELERYSLIGNLATFAFVWFAWIFFRAPDFPTASLVISRLIELEPPVQMSWPYAMAALASLKFFTCFSILPICSVSHDKSARRHLPLATGARWQLCFLL